MAKITPLSDLTSLENQTTAILAINTNSDRIETALANTLSRDGSTPNTMSANLDMNSNRIVNLPAPVADTEPARKVDLDDITSGLTVALVTEAIEALPDVVAAKDATEAFRDEAEGFRDEAEAFIGSATSAQTWTTGRTITFTGDATGVSPTIDGSTNVSLALALAADTVSDTELTTGAAVANIGFTPVNKAGDTAVGATTYTGEVILPTGLTALNQYSAGWRAVPVSTQDTDFTFAMDDSGRLKRHTSGSAHVYTIPPNSSVAFPIGTILVVRNIGAGAVTLTRGAGVALRISGQATDGNKVVSQWGHVALTKEATDDWMVTGAGVT